MTRGASRSGLLAALALAAALGCGKYGPPVRPKPPEATPAPADAVEQEEEDEEDTP